MMMFDPNRKIPFKTKVKFFFWRWRDRWYWLKCFLWKRYNRVHIKTLPCTWTDRCEVLPHVMFQILTDFIEREKPYEWFDTEDSHHKKEWDELRELYDWWKNVALKFDSMYDYDTIEHTSWHDRWAESECGNFYTMLDYKTPEEKRWSEEVDRREKEFEEQLLANMKRLCELRGTLWT